MTYQSTKIIELGSCAFRQPNAAFNRDNAGSNSKRCSYIHGYQLKAKFWFACKELDDKNWVVDFGALKELKQILQNQFDHTRGGQSTTPLLPLFQEISLRMHSRKGPACSRQRNCDSWPEGATNRLTSAHGSVALLGRCGLVALCA